MRFCTSCVLSPAAIIVVFSLSISILRAVPSMSKEAASRFKPISSEISWPPVKMVMSSNIALRRSPKPGALIAHTDNTPLALFTTKVARASPSISSAIISNGWPLLATFSRIPTRS